MARRGPMSVGLWRDCNTQWGCWWPAQQGLEFALANHPDEPCEAPEVDGLDPAGISHPNLAMRPLQWSRAAVG